MSVGHVPYSRRMPIAQVKYQDALNLCAEIGKISLRQLFAALSRLRFTCKDRFTAVL